MDLHTAQPQRRAGSQVESGKEKGRSEGGGEDRKGRKKRRKREDSEDGVLKQQHQQRQRVEELHLKAPGGSCRPE